MVLKMLVTLALATGFAASKPINTPQPLPAYPITKRQSSPFSNGFSGQGFNFIDGFNNFNNQQQVLQIQEQNLQIVDNGFQQAVVQQVNEVLVVQNQQDGFNRDLNNLFRKSSFRRERNEEATVMLVVQQVQVSVDDGRGNRFEQDVFVQSALVANRGARVTNTVMLFESQAIVATQLLGDNRNNGIGGFAGVAGATDAAAAVLPTKTAGIQLLGSRPTWSAVVEDPAATLGAVWQAELEDLQKVEQDQADNQVNDEAAAQEKAALEEEKKKQEEQQQQQGQDGQDQEQQNAEQQQGEEQQNAEASQAAEATSSAAAEATAAAEA